jgi:hypothetical protein
VSKGRGYRLQATEPSHLYLAASTREMPWKIFIPGPHVQRGRVTALTPPLSKLVTRASISSISSALS